VEVLASIALALQQLVLDVRNRSYNNYDLAILQSSTFVFGHILIVRLQILYY